MLALKTGIVVINIYHNYWLIVKKCRMIK